MPGIYSRDNYAQLLANAIENANARRQASLDRSARRTESNLAAIANFGKAVGRTYETWGESDEDRLAALQKEREEAIAAQKQDDNALRDMLHQAGPEYDDNYRKAMAARDMQGYTRHPVVVPDYSEMMKRRGIY